MTYYDDIADGYAELHREEQLKKGEIIRSILRIRPQSSVLDVGCGPGIIDWGGRVTGIDPSEKLLKSAAFKKVIGFAEALPFPDASFDFVVSVTALQNFSDARKAISEMARVARGPAAVSFLKKAKDAKLYEFLFSEFFTIRDIVIEQKDIILIGNKI